MERHDHFLLAERGVELRAPGQCRDREGDHDYPT
jgi:hypothetical protein